MMRWPIEGALPWRMAAVTLALLAACSGCSGDDGDSSERGNAGAGARAGGGAGSGAQGGSRDAGRGGRGAAGEPSEDDAGVAGESGGGSGDCNPRAQEHPHDSLAAPHIAEPLPASAYNSSPPSSGPHCNSWGQYTVFENPPLPACNFLHNLEHGAVALLYNCPEGCDEIAAELEALMQEVNDPDCGGPRRLLLTPYEEMDATVAAAAWGYTFTADCLDGDARSALLEFIAAHLGSAGDAPEATVCAPGQIAP